MRHHRCHTAPISWKGPPSGVCARFLVFRWASDNRLKHLGPAVEVFT